MNGTSNYNAQAVTLVLHTVKLALHSNTNR